MRTSLLVKFLFMMAALFLLAPSLPAQGFERGPALDPAKDYYAVIRTSEGNIPLKLYADRTPRTVKNFVNLAEGTAEFIDPSNMQRVKRPFYNGLTFHDVIPDFRILTGDPTKTGRGGPGYKFDDEIFPDLNFDKPGLMAMANTGPNTNGSQFFVTEKPTLWLNQRHTIFGEIAAGSNGLDVVRKIARMPRDGQDAPQNPVVIQQIDILRVDKGTAPADALKQLSGSAAAKPAEPAKAPEKPAAAPAKTETPAPTPKPAG